VKEKKLEKILVENGAKFLNHGKNHDIWILKNGKKMPIPRHKDIKEPLAKQIIKLSAE